MKSASTTSPEDYGRAVDTLISGEHDDDPFKGVTGTVKDVGSSTVRIMTTVGIIVVTVAMIVAGLKIASMNRQKREEGKQKLIAVFIAAILLFSILTVMLLVQGMSQEVINRK